MYIVSGLQGFIGGRSPDRIASNLRPQLIGNFALLEQLIRDNEVDQVLLALPAGAEGRNPHYVELLREMPVQVLLVPEMQTFHFALPHVADVSDVPMLADRLMLRIQLLAVLVLDAAMVLFKSVSGIGT